MHTGNRQPAATGAALLLLLAGGGCESIVPRGDLQAIARALPPAAEVTTEQRDRTAAAIREGTGVESFEFSDFTFVSETRLPSGTGRILGLFIGGQDEP